MTIVGDSEVPATSKSLLRLFIAALITASFVCAVWQGSARGDVSALGALNGDRANAGLASLAESASLDNLAMRHTQEMAAGGSLYHSSDLSGAMQSTEPGWTRAGENVGVGPSVEAIEAAFMRSTGHRDNILGDFSRAGTAVVTGADGRVWVTQEFALVAAAQSVRAAAAVPGAASPVPARAGAVAGTARPPDPPAKLATACVTDPGGGYWAVAPNGGGFSFKGSTFFVSAGANHLAGPIMGGGIFSFDAPFTGSVSRIPLNAPIVGVAARPSKQGYWLVGADGAVFAMGDAPFYGSAASAPLATPVSGICATATGNGYWLIAADGAVLAFGDAVYGGGINKLAPSTHAPAQS
jgi:hypothetical protein